MSDDPTIALLARSYHALRWCEEHGGECLADHPDAMCLISDLLVEILMLGEPKPDAGDAHANAMLGPYRPGYHPP